MNIAGIGVISTNGRGINAHKKALRRGWIRPLGKPEYCVPAESISDEAALKKTRRADRFSKMAVLSAWDAMQDSGIDIEELKSSLGIIVATAFGAHATTFRFLDDILDYGDDNVSPTAFSNSVHNAAGSYIGSILGAHGPVLTVTEFAFSFHRALALAESWIREGRCDNVLVGSIDEYASVMEYICKLKLKIAADGKIRPFQFSSSPSAVPGEGGVFLLVSRKETPNSYCKITGVLMDGKNTGGNKPDMYILDADGMAGDETRYKDVSSTGALVAGYAPIIGSIITGSSFSCVAAALMLKDQTQYACPVRDNPHAINLCSTTNATELSAICCVKYNCGKERAEIRLER